MQGCQDARLAKAVCACSTKCPQPDACMSFVLQEIDSVEYGLTDIQEYYANTGALKRAAQVRHCQSACSAGASCWHVGRMLCAGCCGMTGTPRVPSNPLLTAKFALQVARPGARIGCTIIEAFSKEVRPAVRGWGQPRACGGGDGTQCTPFITYTSISSHRS